MLFRGCCLRHKVDVSEVSLGPICDTNADGDDVQKINFLQHFDGNDTALASLWYFQFAYSLYVFGRPEQGMGEFKSMWPAQTFFAAGAVEQSI